jgi:hypothetical protein
MRISKSILAVIFCAAAAVSAHAHLIDRTPGGFNFNNGLPPAFLQLINEEVSNQIDFFDEHTRSGWVSQFGVLDGGTYFFTDLTFGMTTANVSWDFTGIDDFSMRWINVFGRDANGDAWGHVYQVTGGESFVSNGSLPVILNGDAEIWSISFYGRSPLTVVPDAGSSLALFGIAVAGLVSYFSFWRLRRFTTPTAQR